MIRVSRADGKPGGLGVGMTCLIAAMTIVLAEGPGDVNEKIIAFARAKIGQTVGDGECSALPTEALRAAGASRQGRTWGDPVASIRDARPGDILVFEGTVFVRTRVRADGAIETLTYNSPHHVAIVSGVRRRGRRVVLAVLQQNVGYEGEDDARRKVVREDVVDPAELRRGTIKAYRPAAGSGDGPRR
jgi:hypothetical protein